MLGIPTLLAITAASKLSLEALTAIIVGTGGLFFSLDTYLRTRRQVLEKTASMSALESHTLMDLERRVQSIDNGLMELRNQHYEIVQALAELKGEIRFLIRTRSLDGEN